jgi:myo-inositol-1(or 4)-monophosphatase
MMTLHQMQPLVVAIAREAGAIIQSMRAGVSVEQKASNNLVTAADLRAQEHIVQQLRTHFPTHHILAEEGEMEAAFDATDLWIIDPLDGTNNYAHGIPQYAVSIAYARGGQTQLGVVLDVCRGELFTARRAEGAWLNEIPLRVSTPTALTESIIATGFHYDRGKIMRRTLRSLQSLFEHNIRGMRRMGAAALDICWVGAGRFDGYFEYRLSPWDYAAAALIAQEAGALLAGPSGHPFTLASQGMICAGAGIFKHLVDIVGDGQRSEATGV